MFSDQLTTLNLVDELQACSKDQFTGCLSVQMSGGEVWKLLFFLGRIVADSGGVHSFRRWQRHMLKYCPQLSRIEVAAAHAAEQDWMNFRLLGQWIRQNTINREQAIAVVEGSLEECLFDLIQLEATLAQSTAYPLLYSATQSQDADIHSAIIPVRVCYVLQKVQQEWDQWCEAGLAELSPNLAPVIDEPNSLQLSTLSAEIRSLIPFIDGQTTIRDLAATINQSSLSVIQGIKPYIDKAAIKLVPISDVSRAAFLTHCAAAKASNKEKKERDLNVDELLQALNEIYDLSELYLGKALATKYLEKSRPQSDWTEKFQIIDSQVQFVGSPPQDLGSSHLNAYSQWMKTFISSCSHIILDFPQLVKRQQIRVNY